MGIKLMRTVSFRTGAAGRTDDYGCLLFELKQSSFTEWFEVGNVCRFLFSLSLFTDFSGTTHIHTALAHAKAYNECNQNDQEV